MIPPEIVYLVVLASLIALSGLIYVLWIGFKKLMGFNRNTRKESVEFCLQVTFEGYQRNLLEGIIYHDKGVYTKNRFEHIVLIFQNDNQRPIEEIRDYLYSVGVNVETYVLPSSVKMIDTDLIKFKAGIYQV